MTQYFQGGGRRASASARTTFTPDTSPFADIAARDTWAAANLDMLFNNVMQYTLIEVDGIGAEQWGGEDTPTSYVAAGWVLTAAEMLTAAQIKALYESNPQTNALVDGKSSVLDALSINDQNERIVSTRSIEVPPGTVYIGSGTAFGSSVRSLHVRSSVTGNTALVIAQLYDETTGFSRAFVYAGGAPETFELNETLGTDVSDTAQFASPTIADQLITELRLVTSSPNLAIDFELYIRTQSHTGPIAAQLIDSITTDGTGTATLNLRAQETPILVDLGEILYITLVCDNLVGVQVDENTFVPNGEVDRILLTRQEIALSSDLATVATSGSYTDLSNTPTIPTPIPARTDEEIQDVVGAFIVDGTGINVAYDDGNDTLTINSLVTPRTDEEIRDLMGVTLVAGMNVTINVDDVANTITVNSTGGSGGGTPPPADADIIYYGLSSTNNPATVDVATLFTENDPTNPDEIPTGTTTQGDFFILLVPMAHDLSSIFSTGLVADVTSIFTATDNVRTLNSEQYKSYVLGALNAGASEKYVINF